MEQLALFDLPTTEQLTELNRKLELINQDELKREQRYNREKQVLLDNGFVEGIDFVDDSQYVERQQDITVFYGRDNQRVFNQTVKSFENRTFLIFDEFDKYKKLTKWTTELIKDDLKKNAFPFAVLMENFMGDFNIGTVIRSANAFGASEVFYLGDDRRDVLAANDAGMTSVVARYGYLEEGDDGQSWDAQYIIDKPTDLLSYL